MESGEITSIVGEQVVVKATGKPPQLGSAVYSPSGVIGVVSDIIGPVEKPYFIVKRQPNSKVNPGEKTRSG